MKLDFDELWRRIERHAGQEFSTKSGKPFTYETTPRGFKPSLTGRFEAEKVGCEWYLNNGPVSGPGNIPDSVNARAYIWAVMHDPRIGAFSGESIDMGQKPGPTRAEGF